MFSCSLLCICLRTVLNKKLSSLGAVVWVERLFCIGGMWFLVEPLITSMVQHEGQDISTQAQGGLYSPPFSSQGYPHWLHTPMAEVPAFMQRFGISGGNVA